MRHLRARLEALGVTAAFDADPAGSSAAAPSPADKTGVGTVRLTCGRHPNHTASAQLTPYVKTSRRIRGSEAYFFSLT